MASADVVGHEAARAEHGQLPPEDLRGAHAERLEGGADEHDAAAGPAHRDRLLVGARVAHALDDDVRAEPAGQLAHGRHRILVRGRRRPRPRPGGVPAPASPTDRVTAMTRAPNALPSWTALEPSPPTPSTTSGLARRWRRAMRLRPWSGVATASVSTASTSGGTGAGGRMSASTGRMTYSANAPSTSTPMRVTCGLMFGPTGRGPRVARRRRDVVDGHLVADGPARRSRRRPRRHGRPPRGRARSGSRPWARSRPPGGSGPSRTPRTPRPAAAPRPVPARGSAGTPVGAAARRPAAPSPASCSPRHEAACDLDRLLGETARPCRAPLPRGINTSGSRRRR